MFFLQTLCSGYLSFTITWRQRAARVKQSNYQPLMVIGNALKSLQYTWVHRFCRLWWTVQTSVFPLALMLRPEAVGEGGDIFKCSMFDDFLHAFPFICIWNKDIIKRVSFLKKQQRSSQKLHSRRKPDHTGCCLSCDLRFSFSWSSVFTVSLPGVCHCCFKSNTE